MENSIKMDDLGVPLFQETPIYGMQWWFFIISMRLYGHGMGDDMASNKKVNVKLVRTSLLGAHEHP